MRDYLPKNENLARAVQSMCSLYLRAAYDIHFHGTEILREQREGFFLLPNHQHITDIPLEGMLITDTIDRTGFYLMKESLPRHLQRLGGIPVPRRKDIRKVPRGERREWLGRHKAELGELKNYLVDLVSQDEILVVHPQGQRSHNGESGLLEASLGLMLELQERSGKTVPFIPLEISYSNIYRPGSRIDMTVRDPIYAHDPRGLRNRLVASVGQFG